MKEVLSIVMVISGALFAAGVVPIAWERAPAWRAAGYAQFRDELAYTLRRVDQLQPALLFVCLASTVGFIISASGTAAVLAAIAAGLLLSVLIGSGTVLVPVQRRLTTRGLELADADVERLRSRWLAGHLVRTTVTLTVLCLLVIAAVT